MLRVAVFLLMLCCVPARAADVADVTIDDIPVATPVYAGLAISDAVPAPVDADAPTAPAASAASDASGATYSALISINTDSPLDLNWAGALELVSPDLRPAGVVLPFLEDYPIDNLEIKLRLLNRRF